jgi:lipoyl-dependent peroxiredoxin
MPVRTADAQWEGSLEDGKGTMRFSAWEGPYSFVSRFEEGPGTNPEELIAAAHAGCYSIELQTEAQVSGIPEETFQEIAEATMKGCPVSQALEAVPIELQAKLVA